MTSFDNKTVKFLQKNHFHTNVLKFVLGCMPCFDAKISDTKTNSDDTQSNPVCNFSTSVPLKKLIL